MLLTTRIRFSPKVQPIKETATDRILEQILYVAQDGTGISAKRIQDIFVSESGGSRINSADLRGSLQRLAAQGRVSIQKKGGYDIYALSEAARNELTRIHQQAESSIRAVVERLFRNAKSGHTSYNDPFLRALSIIFSQLGEESVRLIKGDHRGLELLSARTIATVTDQIHREFQKVDRALFESALIAFFQEDDPDYNAIKWNMAQNYFLTKALGLDPNGALLSKEMFENTTFYLDTNVVVQALEPIHQRHESFLTFVEACKQINASLLVLQISIDELRHVVEYQKVLLSKTIDNIPVSMREEIQSLWYDIYLDRKENCGDCTIDEVFSSFQSPADKMRQAFGIELEDDIWFNDAKYSADTKALTSNLRQKYQRTRGRTKREGPATHDALLLQWVYKQRWETDGDVWIVTNDASLPGPIALKNGDTTSLALTLEALLQWISPIAVSDEGQSDITVIFSEMMKNKLLPQNRFFSLEDFAIFHDLHMSVKELPAKDVEDCVRYIKASAPALDPSDPGDREKLAYEVAKFFADPGREYQLELARLESERLKDRQAFESVLSEYKDALSRSDTRVAKLQEEHASETEKWSKQIDDFQSKLAAIDEQKSEERTRKQARRRLWLSLVIFLVLEALAVYLANQYGTGQNIYQKALDSWEFLLGIAVISIIAGRFIIGADRLRTLSWPIKKIFQSDDK